MCGVDGVACAAALKLIASTFGVFCEGFKGQQGLEFAPVFAPSVAHRCGGVEEEIEVAFVVVLVGD